MQENDRPLNNLTMKIGALALPIAIARLIDLLIMTADLVQLGQEHPNEVGYLGFGWAPFSFMLVAGIGFLSFCPILTAQYIGEGRKSECGGIYAISLVLTISASAVILFLTLPVSFLFYFIGYDEKLMSVGSDVLLAYNVSALGFLLHFVSASFIASFKAAKADILIMIGVLLLNVVLNNFAVLAEEPYFGSRAVDVAAMTAVSRLIGASVFLFYVFRFCRKQSIETFSYREGKLLRKATRLGIPLCFSYGIESISYFGLTLICGVLGVSAVAGYQASMNILNLVFVISIGITSAVAAFSGQAFGSQDSKLFKQVAISGVKISASLISAVAVLVYIFRWNIAHQFTSDELIIETVANALFIACFFLTIESIQILTKGVLRSAGDIVWPMIISVVCFIFINWPLSWLIAIKLNFDVDGLLISTFISITTAAVLNYIRLNYITNKMNRFSTVALSRKI